MRHLIKSLVDKHLSTPEMRKEGWTWRSYDADELNVRIYKPVRGSVGVSAMIRSGGLVRIRTCTGEDAVLSKEELRSIASLADDLAVLKDDTNLHCRYTEQVAGCLCKGVRTVRGLVNAMRGLPPTLYISMAGYKEVRFGAEYDEEGPKILLGSDVLARPTPDTPATLEDAATNTSHAWLRVGSQADEERLPLRFWFHPLTGEDDVPIRISYDTCLLSSELEQ